MSVLHINYGGGNHVRRDDMFGCPVCGIEDAPVIVHHPGSPYYPSSYTCTCCGDSWSEGYLGERPFVRAWRQTAIRKAMAEWDVSCSCPIKRDDEAYVLPCEHEVEATA